MKAFSTALHTRMHEQLQQAALSSRDLLEKSKQSYEITQQALGELKNFVADHQFADKEEEILFFKHVKPGILKEMLYHLRLFKIESEKPVGSPETLKSYYSEQLLHIGSFFEEIKFLLVYIRSGQNYLDEAFFVRNPPGIPLFPQYNLDADSNFSNVYSYKLAKILAYEELAGYLRSVLASGQAAQSPTGSQVPPLTWTANKADLIELIYGLQAAGAFNNGKADVKQVTEWLEHSFQVKIANVYGYFQSMRIRKKNRTPFLDKLKEQVVRRMDESDEFPRFH